MDWEAVPAVDSGEALDFKMAPGPAAVLRELATRDQAGSDSDLATATRLDIVKFGVPERTPLHVLPLRRTTEAEKHRLAILQFLAG